MSYRRRQASLSRALAGARGTDPVTGHPITNREGWGLGIQPGVQVTSFGRHGAGQPAIDGEVLRIEDHGTVVVDTREGERKRSISNLRKVGP